MDDKGAVDLAHIWSVCGQTKHTHIKQYFLLDLKEKIDNKLNMFQ